MQHQALQSRAGTKEALLAAPLCVLLAQLQVLAGDANAKRDLLGPNPLAAFLLAFHLSTGNQSAADPQALLQQLHNHDPSLLQELLVARLSHRVVLATPDSEERLMQEWQRLQQCWLLTTIAARLMNYSDPASAGLAAVFCLLDPELATDDRAWPRVLHHDVPR